jgi:hypothetical protein
MLRLMMRAKSGDQKSSVFPAQGKYDRSGMPM